MCRAPDVLAAQRAAETREAFGLVVRGHDGVGVETARIDDPRADGALREARAHSLQVGREVALEPLLGERPAVAQQAQADLPAGDDRPAPRRIALTTRQRDRDRVSRKSI